MSDKLIVSWEDYNNTVEKLAIQIEESNYKPTSLQDYKKSMHIMDVGERERV